MLESGHPGRGRRVGCKKGLGFLRFFDVLMILSVFGGWSRLGKGQCRRDGAKVDNKIDR